MQDWKLRIQPRHGEPFETAITVAPIRVQAKLTAWRWILRRDRLTLENNIYDAKQAIASAREN
ncbi:hypothetical protein IQ243_24890 [Nostocales cyanobacterium LEGE 11386]|nr:hypothetical protein [Nostocales cyanobacterium LEGE 11386]